MVCIYKMLSMHVRVALDVVKYKIYKFIEMQLKYEQPC